MKKNETFFRMKAIAFVWNLCVLAMLLASCGGKKTGLDDFHRPVYTPVYASGFDILGAEDRESVIIETHTPWQGAENATMRLFIARGGEEPPRGFAGQVLKNEARRIVCMSSTHIAMLDAVGAVQRVVGVSGRDYVSNASIISRGDSIGEVGYEGNVDYECLMALRPDLVLLYGVNGASTLEGKLKELGIPFAYVGEYLEESPLGKAEWLVAVAEMAGRREEGERVFAEIPERYRALKAKVDTASLAAPTVMLNTPYGDAWVMASSESYVARLIADAGGRYVYARNTSTTSESVDLEEAYRMASEADVWINVGMANSLADFRKMVPKFAGVRCVKRGAVFNNNQRTNARGGNDYWESGVVHPDLVLRDLVKIFHPELVTDDFVYYKQLK